ncbi:helix-turn-helix domain-containing protein [Leuconostoc suionicum]|uniref:helix-turn-helix domain-containing protein n=1 Tax=Leuconostoc suionicum TaxID=1511761 RepID=UPI004036AA06
MKLSSRIDVILKKGNRSWYWLGKNADIDMSTIYRLKNENNVSTSFETMEKIADALDVSLDEFRTNKK